MWLYWWNERNRWESILERGRRGSLSFIAVPGILLTGFLFFSSIGIKNSARGTDYTTTKELLYLFSNISDMIISFFWGGEARDIRAWDWICCYTHTITSSLSSEIFLYRLHPCNNNKGAAAWRYSICIINHVATRKKKSVILFLLFFWKKIKWHLYFWFIGMNWTNGSKWIKLGLN